jgi:hypothetical protein
VSNIALTRRKAYRDWRCAAGRQRHDGARGADGRHERRLLEVRRPDWSTPTSKAAPSIHFKARKLKARSAGKQQRQAGDPESTIHEAWPLSVHKNGGAR